MTQAVQNDAKTHTVPQRMGQNEFIALTAMMFATVSFSTDAMLPAFSEIAQQLTPQAPNRAQLILTTFILGMGIGTFVSGPLSDRFGRKSVMTWGAMLYCASAAVAWMSHSLELLLIARVCQGLGASGPRVVMLAVLRDLYSGRNMARIMSFAMMIFTLFPAIAPLLGEFIMDLSTWRSIFLAFILFSFISWAWMMLRLNESLPQERRRPFRLSAYRDGILELLSHPTVRVTVLVQSLVFGTMFSMLSLVQPVFAETFHHGDSFAIWFGVVAILSGSASLLNAKIVMVLGMRRVVTVMLSLQVVFSAIMVTVVFIQPAQELYFAIFVIWMTTVFFQAGLTIGNLNAVAMEPMGHMAGMAASMIGGIATVISLVLAVPVGQLFQGTPMPLAVAIFLKSLLAVLLMRYLARIEQA